MKGQYLESGINDFNSKPIEMAELSRMLLQWVPAALVQKKAVEQEGAEPATQAPPGHPGGRGNGLALDIVSLLDGFGMYASKVMREIDNDLEAYVERLAHASATLGTLVDRVKEDDRRNDLEEFVQSMNALRNLLYDIGARDCARLARNLKRAALSSWQPGQQTELPI